MSVPEQTPYKEYTGNGVTKNFALEFTCDSKQELKVFIDNVEPELSTWSLVGGSVVFTTVPASGSKIVLKRATRLERTTNYSSTNNSFRPEVINKDLDRIWYALQDQAYKLGQYDFDYTYAVNTSNQAKQTAQSAHERADDAYDLADTTNTEIRDIERGGTGADNAADARINLEVYSQAEVDALVATGGQGSIVGVSGGGTGGTTAAEARTNLGVPSTVEVAEAIDSATPPASTTAKGIIELATQSEVNAGTDTARAITPSTLKTTIPIQTKTTMNADGEAPMFACRAWVSFNGTGAVAIKGSGNVSSITDNGVGDYTVNFAVQMRDWNYAVTFGTSDGASGSAAPKVLTNSNAATVPYVKNQFGVRVGHTSSADTYDFSVAIFRQTIYENYL